MTASWPNRCTNTLKLAATLTHARTRAQTQLNACMHARALTYTAQALEAAGGIGKPDPNKSARNLLTQERVREIEVSHCVVPFLV